MEGEPTTPDFSGFTDDELHSMDLGYCEQRWDLMDSLRAIDLTLAAIRNEVKSRHGQQ